jgi:hypothetical protein
MVKPNPEFQIRDMPAFGQQLPTVLAESPRFHDEIARLRVADSRPRRHGPAFSTHPTVESMLNAVAAAAAEHDRCNDEKKRPRWGAWSAEACERNGIYSEPQSPLSALQAHAKRLQRDAALFCGSRSLANELLAFVRGQGPLPVLGAIASQYPRLGPGASYCGASSMYAELYGDPDWPREGRRKAWDRFAAHGRTSDDGSVYMIDADEFVRLCAAAARPKP